MNVQLWLKELRRLEAKVSPDHVEYALANELNVQQAKQYLPVVNCRDCGATGWASRLSPEMESLRHALARISVLFITFSLMPIRILPLCIPMMKIFLFPKE